MGHNWRPFFKDMGLGHQNVIIKRNIVTSPHFTAATPSDAAVPGAVYFVIRKSFNFGFEILTAITMNSAII
jgi:hypothetical protein